MVSKMTGLDIDEMSEYLQTPKGKKKFSVLTKSMDEFTPFQKNQFLYKSLKAAKNETALEHTQNAMRRLGFKESDIISKSEMVKRHNAGYWS